MTTKIAVIGDRFMLPSAFQTAIEARLSKAHTMTTLEQPWPDERMEHGYATPGMDGLKEYMGSADEIIAAIDDAEILVTHLAPMSRNMLAQLPNLRCIAVARGGPVNIDMAAAREAGVRVVNVPGRNASAVAEFTIGAILAETRLIRLGHEALREGNFRGDLYRADRTGSELNELTVGVIGYGAVGTRLVQLLKPFGCRILVCDPYKRLSNSDSADGVQQVTLAELLPLADVVTQHARVTPETEHMMNADTFASMKPGSYFVNTARGPLCDYDALLDALNSGHLRGAMLETFSIEPPPVDWPLLQHPNVTLSPHIAGASTRTVTFAAEAIADEVERYVNDQPPINPC